MEKVRNELGRSNSHQDNPAEGHIWLKNGRLFHWNKGMHVLGRNFSKAPAPMASKNLRRAFPKFALFFGRPFVGFLDVVLEKSRNFCTG